MKKLHIKLTFTESLLGTSPADEKIYTRFIGGKAPDAATLPEEVAALGSDAVVERGTTVFPRDEDGKPFLYDYQIKGFFKDSCGFPSPCGDKLQSSKGATGHETGKKKKAVNESGKLTAYKKVIDGLIFVQPRKIVLELPEGKDITICQRPLRAQTAQGERVALSSSEEVPAGTSCELTVLLLDENHEKVVREWLDYGSLRGIGQWRNSGKGAFEWEEIE